MSDNQDDFNAADLEDDGVLDPSDSLEGDPGDDPLDQGYAVADRWSAGEGFGTTSSEERAGESLDQLLAEEEPETDPYAEGEDRGDTDAGNVADSGRLDDADNDDADEAALDSDPAPRAGRLLAEDEGAHEAVEADLVARDVGIDAGAASAEEAAVHVVDEPVDEQPDEQ